MKIRTDFVTNSSSSSFILTIKFELDNGETIMWEGKSDVGEGAYEYIQKVKEETGHDKVNVVSISQGGSVANMLFEIYKLNLQNLY